jgi:multidrug efflux pump subunit AcrA (membrane-fusion protein)
MKRKLKNNSVAMEHNWKLYHGHPVSAARTVTLSGVQRFLVILLLLLSCTPNDTAHQHDTYTCPMHPTVVADRPGTCPVCQMDLVRKARPGEEVAITEDVAMLLNSPNESVIASVRTIRPQYQSMAGSVHAQGIVTYDSRHLYTIPVRTGGRIERLFLKYAYQRVAKGEKVAEIYSPELNTAARELVYILENDAKNDALITSTSTKLRLLGLSDAQIKRIIDEKKVDNTISIYSPYSGYVITDEATTPTQVSRSVAGVAAGMDGMATSAGKNAITDNQPTATLLKEGDYVSAGQTLFRIVDDQALRIDLDVPASRSAAIAQGDTLMLDAGKETTEAVVDLVQPFFNEGENFVRLRIYTHKTKSLHIGQLLTASITPRGTASLWVPRESVIDLGLDKIVFVKERNAFKPRKVSTGTTSDGQVEITGGLASSEEIAANAQFLVDSESFVKTIN